MIFNKSKLLRILLYIILNLVLIVIVACHVLEALMYQEDEEIKETTSSEGAHPDVEHIYTLCDTLRTVLFKSKKKSNALVIGIHGAPGGWDAFKSYMLDEEIIDQVDFLAYDRPGYGGSNYGNAYTSISDQAKVIEDIIKHNPSYDEYFLISHSYGGPIGIKFCISHPGVISHHLMLAPAIDPASEKYFWFSPLAHWKLTRWLLPSSFITAGFEKYSHEKELNKLKPHLPLLTTPTTLIHGMKDGIAPSGNIDYTKKHISKTYLMVDILQDEGHLVLWQNKKIVKDKLMEILEAF